MNRQQKRKLERNKTRINWPARIEYTKGQWMKVPPYIKEVHGEDQASIDSLIEGMKRKAKAAYEEKLVKDKAEQEAKEAEELEIKKQVNSLLF